MTTSVQWALLTPVVFLGLLGVIQGAVWLGARATVQQAAMAGAEHAAFAGAQGSSARDVAQDVALRGGVNQVSVALIETGDGIQVEVSGRATTILPGPWSEVAASSYRLKEPT